MITGPFIDSCKNYTQYPSFTLLNRTPFRKVALDGDEWTRADGDAASALAPALPTLHLPARESAGAQRRYVPCPAVNLDMRTRLSNTAAAPQQKVTLSW